ncbi:MAG: hypothetical protein ACXITR_06610 [Cyanobacterium sp.]
MSKGDRTVTGYARSHFNSAHLTPTKPLQTTSPPFSLVRGDAEGRGIGDLGGSNYFLSSAH